MAGSRRRGHRPVLRAAASRGRNDQVDSATNPRPRHRLALPQRTEEGVEGMTLGPIGRRRRTFLTGAAMAGTCGLLGLHPAPARAEPPPETTRIRLDRSEGICIAPQYVAEDLLRAEGFSEVTYVPMAIAEKSRAVASGEVDVCLHFAAPATIQVDRGDPITMLAGIHVGCFELFGA